jgi:putative ATP-dependent endonuclease of OLD family
MRIRELEIMNFRNIDFMKICPRKIGKHDLVVLIGENNAGKTNVLTLLHLLFDPVRSIRTLDLCETDFRDIDKPITATIVFEDLSEEMLAEFFDVLDFVPGTDQSLLSLTFNCTYDKDTRECEPKLVFTRDLERIVSFSEKRMFSFYLQDALRDYRTIHSGKTSLFTRMLRQIDISQQEQHMIERFNEASEILQTNEQINDLRESIHRIASNIIDLPADHNAIRLTVAASNSVDLKRSVRIQLRQPDATNYLDVDELGLGLQSVLTMSIFRAFAGIGQLRDGIFAIDEPEAHLHPHSQRAMYREIMDLSTMRQVWVATHSPSLVEHIDPRHIVRISKMPTGTSSAVQLPEDFPEEYVFSYEKHLDAGKSDAFFSKAVLLVEGPTEHGFFPTASLVLAKTSPLYHLDRIGVAVVCADGKNNIKTLARLLKNFDIPCQVIVDWDEDDNNHERVVREIKEITPYVFEYDHVAKMGDIEGMLCLHVPIAEMIQFEDDILPEKFAIGLVMQELKKVVKSADSHLYDQISVIQRQKGRLADVADIIVEFVEKYPDLELSVRATLAQGLRKIKTRTTGRLLAERFTTYVPSSLVACLENVIRLAGYTFETQESEETNATAVS